MRPILTRDVALTVAKALRHCQVELFQRYKAAPDIQTRMEIKRELQMYELALLWLGSQTPP